MSSKKREKPHSSHVPKLRFPEFRNAEEWGKKTLEDVSEIVRGGSPRPIEDFITNSTDGLNWLKIGDVSPESKYITKTQERVIKTALSKTRVVYPGDLILSNSMSFGRPYILKIESCIHDGWIAITNISKKVKIDYLYYLISSDACQVYFSNNAAGAVVQNLNADIIKKLPIATPSLLEQQKIADCLSSLEDVLTAQTQKIEGLKNHKKGLMQKLFPSEGESTPTLRFLEFNGEWEEKKVNKLLTIGNGKDYKHLSKGDIPVYGTGGYMLSVNDYLYEGESVCIGRKGTIDKPMLLTGKFWTVDTLFYTHSFKKCLPKFIFLCFQNIDWINYNAASGVPSLSKSTIDAIEIRTPSLLEQQKIADCLTSLDDLIAAHTQKLLALKTLKKGLMQQLFPAPDAQAPA